MQHVTENNIDPCAGFLDRLDMWLASELDADQNTAMQAHHDVCPACQLEVRLARAIDAITEALPEQICPELRRPGIREAGAKQIASRQPAIPSAALPGQTYIARLLATWRQPLVFVPALALVLGTLSVLRFIVPATSVDPELVIIDGQEYTREEIMRATQDLQVALRYLDKYGSYPAKVVQSQLEQSRLPLPPPEENPNTPSI